MVLWKIEDLPVLLLFVRVSKFPRLEVFHNIQSFYPFKRRPEARCFFITTYYKLLTSAAKVYYKRMLQ